jgi:hypothetical protein
MEKLKTWFKKNWMIVVNYLNLLHMVHTNGLLRKNKNNI